MRLRALKRDEQTDQLPRLSVLGSESRMVDQGTSDGNHLFTELVSDDFFEGQL